MVRLSLVLGLSLASNCLSSNPDWDEAVDEGSTGADGSTSATPKGESSTTTSVGTSSPTSTVTGATSTTTSESTGDETAGSSSTTGSLPAGRITDGLATLYTFVFDPEGPDMVFDVSGIDPPVDLTISPNSTTAWAEDGLRVTDNSSLSADAFAASRFGTQAFTVELWVDSQSPDVAIADGPRIVAFEDHLAPRANFYVAGGDGIIGMNVVVDEAGGTEQFLLNVEPGLRHVVFTVSAAGQIAGYEDGQLEVLGRIPEQTPMLWQDQLPFIVANASDNGHPWLGTLGLLAIYERALTDEEVVHNFEQGP